MTDLWRRTTTALVYGAAVLIAVLASREVFVAGVGAIVSLGLVEIVGLRRAGVAAVLELAVLGLGAGALVFLRDLATVPSLGGLGHIDLASPLLMTIFAVWAADVVAYVVGSTIGRRRIAPRVSPGKTWEGTVAGVLAAAAVVVLWNRPLLGVHVWWVVTAVSIGPTAFAGDLLESWVKRRAGVKDSGRLLPGHGGILDRIDSLFAAAPLVAGAIILLGRMG